MLLSAYMGLGVVHLYHRVVERAHMAPRSRFYIVAAPTHLFYSSND